VTAAATTLAALARARAARRVAKAKADAAANLASADAAATKLAALARARAVRKRTKADAAAAAAAAADAPDSWRSTLTIGSRVMYNDEIGTVATEPTDGKVKINFDDRIGSLSSSIMTKNLERPDSDSDDSDDSDDIIASAFAFAKSPTLSFRLFL
jgi:hypothetical protein